MKKLTLILILLTASLSFSQDDVKPLKIGNFLLQFYIDSYYSSDFETLEDSLVNVRPFSSNCGFNNEYRLNIAALYINYNSENIRGVFATQYGDVPFLTTPTDKQYIKFVKLANFGFKIGKSTWLDVGYMGNPIGVESSIPYKNIISTVSTMGYFEPGNLIGISFSHSFSEKLSATLLFYNSWNISSANNTNKSIASTINYRPSENMNITYSNSFGNEGTLKKKDKWLFYNNIICQLTNTKFDLIGQIDFASESNGAKIYNDDYGYMFAGLIIGRYKLNKHLSITARVDFFNDPNGIISQGDAGTDNRLHTWEVTAGFEVSPFKNAYFRFEYSYINADQNIFIGSNHKRNNITLTTGIKL